MPIPRFYYFSVLKAFIIHWLCPQLGIGLPFFDASNAVNASPLTTISPISVSEGVNLQSFWIMYARRNFKSLTGRCAWDMYCTCMYEVDLPSTYPIHSASTQEIHGQYARSWISRVCRFYYNTFTIWSALNFYLSWKFESSLFREHTIWTLDLQIEGLSQHGAQEHKSISIVLEVSTYITLTGRA